jgi:hypothetical protein
MYRTLAILWALSLGVFSSVAYKTGADREAAKFLKYRNAQQVLVIQQEEKHLASLAEQLKDKEDAIKTINKRHAGIVNGLRQRAERPVPSISQETPVAPVSSGARSTGESLYREDAEFLIGEAAKADILREALTVCRKQLSMNN